MASVFRHSQRNGFRISFYIGEAQREYYFPGTGKKAEGQARSIAGYLEDLSQSKSHGIKAAPESLAWVASLEPKNRAKLVAWGLADPVSEKLKTEAGRMLGPFLDAYIAGRTDCAENTIKNFKQLRNQLCGYFGERKLLVEITIADAQKWQRWMIAKKLAVSTISKHCKRAKTVFKHAVDDRLLEVSPMACLKGGDESNSERFFFVDEASSQKILEACPDVDWRVIFALARYGGLRCPSEVLVLTWNDVDLPAGKLRIDSPKTGLRYCPIFPELNRVLNDAWEQASEGATHVVSRYREKTQNLRTQLCRIIKQAGLVPWAKPFQNLRSTRRTELQRKHPSHVVDAWLGQSTEVANKHYLQVTSDDWQQAIARPEKCSVTGSVVESQSRAEQEPSSQDDVTKKPLENMVYDGFQGFIDSGQLSYPVPPVGLEPTTR